jgi:hypothetical protein
MMDPLPLLPLPPDFEVTRATLHAYSKAVGAVPRALAIPHPKWWHVSLGVSPTGLVTDTMRGDSGDTFLVRMDLRAHRAVVETSHGEERRIPFDAGMSATEFGDRLVAAVAEFAASPSVDRDRYHDEDARRYDPAVATAYFDTLVSVAYNLELHRASLEGDVGPVQVWPHGFDVAFEWFGTREVIAEEGGVEKTLPSQINFGFYPGGAAYFYANPWPFEADRLLPQPLPAPGDWHTEGWEGASLRLAAAADSQQVLDFFAAVFRLARPTLLA